MSDLRVSKTALPLQEFKNIIFINSDFYVDQPLPYKFPENLVFAGGFEGVLSGGQGDIGLNSTKHTFAIGAMHPADRGFGEFPGSHNNGVTLSAIAVAFNLDNDADVGTSQAKEQFSHATRKVHLSAGPQKSASDHHQQCQLLTHLSGAFNVGLLFPDGSMNTYHVPSLSATSHDRGGAQAFPLTAVNYRSTETASDPHIRRLTQLGYR